MTVKLFELTPLGEFFFGGEATFGPENRHYYVRSNLLPQQTSLLGLLRHELLKSNPQAFDLVTDRIRDKTAAAELVGSQGFDGSTDKAFGIIEGLSPVFLLDEKGTPYFLQARLELMVAHLLVPRMAFRAMPAAADERHRHPVAHLPTTHIAAHRADHASQQPRIDA